MADHNKSELLKMTSDVISAFVSNNAVAHNDLPQIIAAVHAALEMAASPAPVVEAESHAKASTAQIRRSIGTESLVSFEDGKTYKSLKRHLTRLGLTVADYRAKWGLPDDYPMVSPAYSQKRSDLAKAMGLGAKGRPATTEASVVPVKRGRSKKAAIQTTTDPSDV